MYKVGEILYCNKQILDADNIVIFKKDKGYKILVISKNNYLYFRDECNSYSKFNISTIDRYFVTIREAKLKKILCIK